MDTLSALPKTGTTTERARLLLECLDMSKAIAKGGFSLEVIAETCNKFLDVLYDEDDRRHWFGSMILGMLFSSNGPKLQKLILEDRFDEAYNFVLYGRIECGSSNGGNSGT